MSHYFKNDSNLKHNVENYDVKINETSLRLFTDRGVFSKSGLDYGTRFLLETLVIEPHMVHVLDMGCGYGPIGLYLAKTYPFLHVDMADVNTRALDLVNENIKTNQVDNVRVFESDLFENIKGQYDMIVTNPPIRAGKKVIFKLYEDAHHYLKDDGTLAVVIQKKQGAPSTYEKLKTLFDIVEVLDKSKGFWAILAKKTKL
ncbi:MAG: class I SAM-dependent methyltransferase [Acholeplasmataceae bacterium]